MFNLFPNIFNRRQPSLELLAVLAVLYPKLKLIALLVSTNDASLGRYY